MSSTILLHAICAYCKKEFLAKKTNTQCCSSNCSKRYYLEKKKNEKIVKAIEKINTKTDSRASITYAELKDKELLTIKDTCKLLNITDVTLRRWIKAEKIITSRLGKKHLIKRSHINELM